MQPFSYLAGRRLPGAAAVVALLVLAAGPAHAASARVGKGMVSANDVQSVITYLKSKGDTVEQGESDIGNPMLTESNNYYEVYFYCDDNHTNCTAIQFRACYSDYPDAGVEQTNALSRDYFFAKSYIDNDGNACIEMPVSTGLKGISYEAVSQSFDAFVGFSETSDDAFGARSN